jgi:hypothetical protein
MSKDKIADYDGTTAGNNTDIGGISIAEGMLPSAVNNSMRELTKQLGAFANGTDAIDALDVTGAATVGGAFTSPGIDDNADATAITIDSSENVLVGKSVTTLNTTGLNINGPDGRLEATASGNVSGIFNRTSSDGDVIDIRHSGTVVGSIGTNGDRMYFTTANKGFYVDESGSEIVPSNGTGGNTNNIMNLGNSASAFKDLYLGGNLYLGGTGSANALDDYETGTWTPTLPNGHTGAFTVSNAIYTKIGRQVYIGCHLSSLNIPSNSTEFRIGGLPFSVHPSVYHGASSITFVRSHNIASFHMLPPTPQQNGTALYFHRGDGTNATVTNSQLSGMTEFIFAVVYQST